MTKSITIPRNSVAVPPGPPPYPDLVWVPGGEFTMGSDRHYREEAPAHRVSVPGFWIDKHPVTNAHFARFVEQTGYVTAAERPADPEDYPSGADPALLAPASAVFTRPSGPGGRDDAYRWWSYLPGADWRHPRGPGSSLQGLERHPVVHVTWVDVVAYADWAGRDLPTEAEWEYAARGGLDGAEYAWGDEFTPGGRHLANTWQGDFPTENLCLDGYEWISPVDAFPANGYGVQDMIGNVWEWTADWYADHRRLVSADYGPPVGAAERSPRSSGPNQEELTVHGGESTPTLPVNPTGGTPERSFDPATPRVRVPRKVIKGGSYLSAPNYCRRYRPAARLPQAVNTSTCHVGFRCVVRPEG